MSSSLDANDDPHHWTYKAPGLVAWSLIFGIGYTLTEYPTVALFTVRLLGVYVLLRVMVAVVFYPVGLYQIRRTLKYVQGQKCMPAPRAVHHVVIIPNYNEPVELLARTLDSLSRQSCARRRLIVVLAMEAAEPGALAKGRCLRKRYAAKFAHLLVTVHPANLPNEAPGKAANQRWAARQARIMLDEQPGLSIDWTTLTSCDADSRLHPAYFETVARSFAATPERHHSFWQSPLRFDNNIWRVAAPVRVLTLLANVVNLSELANPFMPKLTQSTYTLSYRLAERIDYWDGCVIAEDSNILLRALFATGGRVTVRPVMLPTQGDAVEGDDLWQTMRNFYRQRMRHAWGCQNLGYILQQWNRHEGITLSQKLLYLLQVLQDYTLFATAALVLGISWFFGFVITGSPVISFFHLAIPAYFFVALNLLGAVSTWIIWGGEHIRCAYSVFGWRPSHLIADVVTWCVMPVITLTLAVAPVLHANTRMLIGGRIRFVRTEKEGARIG